MPDTIAPQENLDIVNLIGSRKCCCCGITVPKRKQMWKFPHDNYMRIPCKIRFDEDKAGGTFYSADTASVANRNYQGTGDQ